MALWTRIQSLFFGGAIAAAAADGIKPPLEPVRQHAWKRNQLRVLDPAVVARMVAQALVDIGAAEEEASRNGLNPNRVNALVQLEQRAPAAADAQDLRRRKRISRDQLLHAFAKEQIEPQYWDALAELVDERLNPEAVANAVQQGFVPGAGLLPPTVDGPPFDIPVEEVNLDTLAEFEAFGIDAPRAKVLAELSGNPPSPEQLAEMVMRGQIPESGFFTGLREGRTKTKWSSALLYYLTHPRLTPGLVINLLLRGWIEKPEADRRLHAYGYTPEQVQDWFDSAGRPMAPVQAFTAFFRGAPSPTGAGAFTKADFVNAIRRSDIRPEYTDPLWGIRFAYPSLFQLRNAVQSGAITPERALVILKYERYEEQDAQSLVTTWTGATAAAGKALTKAELADEFEAGYITEADYRTQLTKLGYTGTNLDLEVHLSDARRLKRWREKVVDAIAKAFIEHDIDANAAAVDLAGIGVTGEAATRLIGLWQLEQRVARKHLTAAQVKRAYRRNIITQADALAALANLAFSPTDAATYLAE